VNLAGETDQAAPLLRVLDNSSRLANSSSAMPIAKVGNSEVFRIRSSARGAAVTITDRDRKALQLLAGALVLLGVAYFWPDGWPWKADRWRRTRRRWSNSGSNAFGG
jgi:hypothetical protein